MSDDTLTGPQIRGVRKMLEMSQAEFAAALGVSRRTVGNLEKDPTPPRMMVLAVRQLMTLARA